MGRIFYNLFSLSLIACIVCLGCGSARNRRYEEARSRVTQVILRLNEELTGDGIFSKWVASDIFHVEHTGHDSSMDTTLRLEYGIPSDIEFSMMGELIRINSGILDILSDSPALFICSRSENSQQFTVETVIASAPTTEVQRSLGIAINHENSLFIPFHPWTQRIIVTGIARGGCSLMELIGLDVLGTEGSIFFDKAAEVTYLKHISQLDDRIGNLPKVKAILSGESARQN